MAEYKIPQDVLGAKKIFGPLTFKDFGIVCGAGALVFVLWNIFVPNIAVPLILVIVSLTILIVFVRPHGMRFSEYFLSRLIYHLRPRKRLWIMHAGEVDLTKEVKEAKKEIKEDRLKKVAEHKIRLAHDVGGISKMVDELRNNPLK